MMRISVDLPAPFGPSRPNMPGAMASETSSSARVPFGYVFDRLLDAKLHAIHQTTCRARSNCVLGGTLPTRKGRADDVGGKTRRSAVDEVIHARR